MHVLSFVTGLALFVTVYGQSCPPFFLQYRTSCYRFVAEYLTWSQADQYCTYYKEKSYDVHLVTIETSQEHEFLRSIIRNDPNLNLRDFWMGLSRIDRFRSWIWAPRAREISYEDWGNGQPGISGNCALMNAFDNWRWADYECTEYMPFVCELELKP